jgi:hypothetical protein
VPIRNGAGGDHRHESIDVARDRELVERPVEWQMMPRLWIRAGGIGLRFLNICHIIEFSKKSAIHNLARVPGTRI